MTALPELLLVIPARMLINVDFSLAPFGPNKAIIAPLFIENETSFKAVIVFFGLQKVFFCKLFYL